jgi:hypothetical protein
MQSVGEEVVSSVGEVVLGFSLYRTGVQQMREIPVEGDLAQTDHDADARQGTDLCRKVDRAVANLRRQWLVTGWGAADHRGYPRVAKLQPIVTRDGTRFAGKTELMENGVHEVAGAVTGERAAGPVRSVSARSKSKDEDSSAGIAKAGYGPRPVDLILVGATPGLADASAIVPKTGAALTRGNGFMNLLKDRNRTWSIGNSHSFNDSRL